jgi:hypothetical protein
MALWGNNNNIDNVGEVTDFNYTTKVLTGTGTSFGETGSAQVGDVLKIGLRSAGVGATYYGDVVIVSIASTLSCTVAATEALIAQNIGDLASSGFAGTSFYATQQPKFALLDTQNDRYRNQGSLYESDSLVYGISTSGYGSPTYTSQYEVAHEGWVGVTTYVGSDGNLRVKKEVLVAMSGITTGASSIPYPTSMGA